MEHNTNGEIITVSALIDAPVEKVWKLWSDPEAILKWNAASDDWHTTKAEVNLEVGKSFKSTMAAKDGSMSFDFEGVYEKIEPNKHLTYSIADGRKVSVDFAAENGKTRVVEMFEAESTHPVDLQRGGWQAILDNFKKYAETTEA